ncbi:MAG: hypothetical protein M3209_14380 [Acidobacteriota bacterium]|nr:hypothetical protein [Acidobacteriota bacterium]
MKLKLGFLIAIVFVLAIYIPAVQAQANLTFSGGNGTPLSITLQQAVTYTINNNQCFLHGGRLFVFDATGNPLGNVRDVTGTITSSVNGGVGDAITNARSGFSLNSISTNDIYIYNGNSSGPSSGQVLLSAGTITTTTNVAAAPPANGSYTTFIVSAQGTICSTNGVATTTYTISGTVSYAISPSKLVADVLLSTSGAPPATTNASGFYQFSNLLSGNYTITPSKSGSINGITAFDATLVLRCVAAGTVNCTLSNNQKIAANTDGDANVTAFDATQILRFVAANAPNASTGQVGNWKFNPINRTYSNLNANQSNQNYAAILVGDVDGDWAP